MGRSVVMEQLDTVGVMLALPFRFQPAEIRRAAEACTAQLKRLLADVPQTEAVLRVGLTELSDALAKVSEGPLTSSALQQSATAALVLRLTGPVKGLLHCWQQREQQFGCTGDCAEPVCHDCAR